jgi:histidinol-phosphate phosphatase family protein
MKAVIMAGGKGARLSSVTHDEIPKPMASVCGKPILEHQLRVLTRYGIEEVIIISGFLHHKIESYFGGGEKFGIPIRYIIEEAPRGTGGSLCFLKEELKQDFVLLFGDIILDVSILKMAGAHRKKNATVTLFAHPNSHPYDSDVLITTREGWVAGYYAKKEPRTDFYRNLVNAGMYIIHPLLFERLPDDKEKIDLEKDIIFPLCKKEEGKVFAYISPEYVKDVGTPRRLYEAEEDITRGIVAAKNLDKPQKCIFLDRDGTLNRFNDFIWQPGQLVLEETAARAVKAVNKSDYLTVVVTNQPAVARGLCTEEDMGHIHNKLETLLGEQGAYLDGIIYCPHHPDKGYPGERPEYKVQCRCRKPGIGMIEECAERFHIDLTKSFMIGDSTVDIQTGINAGMKTIMVKTGQAGSDKKYNVQPDWVCANVEEAVQTILGGERQ